MLERLSSLAVASALAFAGPCVTTAAAQSSDWQQLDAAHEAWIRCVVAAAGAFAREAETAEAAETVEERAYRACPSREAELRAVLVRLHPEAAPADLDDIVAQFRSRTRHLAAAAIANARRR